MSWDEIMRRVLPPMRDEKTKITYVPHVTSPYGDTNRPPGSTNPHRAVDFNYNLGPGGQRGINLIHPALRSPVAGVVTRAGDDKYGTIAIKDANGLSHEILHTNSRHVAVGDPVIAGQLIGTMGNTGADHQHVHYQLKDRAGNVLNPSAFWDEQGSIDPNPPSPAYLNDYLQYQRGLGTTVNNAFGNTPDTGPRYAPQLTGMTPPDPVRPGPVTPPPARNDVRVLRSRIANAPAVSGLSINPVGPLPNEQPPADGAASFNDRFGNWASSAGASAPLAPYQQFSPPPQSARPLGIVSGQPMPDYPFPPPIFDFSSPGDEDWAASKRRRADWKDGRG